MKTINTAFTRVEFETEDERIQASIFNVYQLAAIQNDIAIAAEEKIRMKFDPLNPQAFVQEEAELTGRILALQWLVTQHEESLAILQSRNSQLN